MDGRAGLGGCDLGEQARSLVGVKHLFGDRALCAADVERRPLTLGHHERRGGVLDHCRNELVDLSHENLFLG